MTTGEPIQYKKYKSDTDKARVYNHRLAVAERDFDSWADKARDWWDRYENMPKRTQATSKGLVVNVPTGVGVIDALFSGLTAIDVQFGLDALGKASPEQAALATVALNQEWARLNVDDDRDDAIKDALITGMGWLKVGYDFYERTERVERDVEDVRAEVNRLIDEAIAAGLEPPTADQIAKLIPTEETVTFAERDRIVVDYVPWDMVRFDPTARRVKDIRWVAQLTKLPLYEVKSNPLYREYAKRSRRGLSRLDDLKGDSAIDKELQVTGKPTEDDQRVTVVEMWDLETGTICTFAKGNTWLLHESVNPFAMFPDMQDRSGFVPVVLRKSTRRVRGISDMDVMVRSLNEKNLYRSRTAEFIRRAVPKVAGPEDALTEEGKEALSSEEVNAYVSVDQKYSADKVITPLTPAPLPEQAFGMNDRIDQEIREATGVNELMRGLFPDRKRTATETSEVVSASAARQSEKRNLLERFHVEVAKRMLRLMMQFYDQPRMVRFADPQMGEVEWEFTGEDIIGDFDLRVTLEPREAPTRDAQREEATVALNVLGPLAQPGPDGSSTIDPTKLVAWFMRKYGFSSRDIAELLNTQDQRDQQTVEAMALNAAAQAAGQNPEQAASGLQTAEVPPEVAAAGVGGFGPGAPQSAAEVSRSAGTRT